MRLYRPYSVFFVVGFLLLSLPILFLVTQGLDIHEEAYASVIVLGDVDKNGYVNIFDFNEVVGYFGRTQINPYLDADLDRNGKVDIFDFNEVVANFLAAEAIYPFYVNATTSIQAVVSVDSGIPFDEKTRFFFARPDGRIITIPFIKPEEAVEYENNHISYGDQCGAYCAIFKLFPQDPAISPIAGQWQFVVVIFTKVATDLVFGFTQF